MILIDMLRQYGQGMRVLSRNVIYLPSRSRSKSRSRDMRRPWDRRPKNETYRDGVSPRQRDVPDPVRAQQFAAYLGRLVGELADRPGWSVSRVIEESRISRPTFYRWRRANWSKGGKPKADNVRSFHVNLGIDASRALEILGLSTAPTTDDPLSVADPDVQQNVLAILRRLRDPNEPDEERYFIRRSLADLARRPATSYEKPEQSRNRRTG